MVASHERSGTHFLINTLAGNYGYMPLDGVLDLDPASLKVNFHLPPHLVRVLKEAAIRRPQAIVKTHLSVEFFAGTIDDILRRQTIFYIYRHPVDVMISFWRYVYRWPWREGPRTRDVVEFAASEPEGQMIRYQMKQYPNLLQRWRHHVEGWLDAAAEHDAIVPVAYDALDCAFDETARTFAEAVGRPPIRLVRPGRETDVVRGARSDALPAPDREALLALAIAEVGDTMRRLNFL